MKKLGRVWLTFKYRVSGREKPLIPGTYEAKVESIEFSDRGTARVTLSEVKKVDEKQAT